MYEESFHIQLHKAGFSFNILFIELVFFVPVSWNGGDIVTPCEKRQDTNASP